MTNYWCSFFDERGLVLEAQSIEAADDVDVIAKAREIQATGLGSGYEIRDGRRLVDWVKERNRVQSLL